ncbi:histidine phosphatase family protein [uncultured Jatrophihabitans sp.]|uniref:histidine phosphatase family protein n=1 Tax=uncultured Jatrophihabitans sp. TaxID=1610747 RepID=UPI0035CC9D49
MSARRLILLRHGQTAWNAEHRFQGHVDPPLDDVGREQARAAAEVLAAMQPDLLVSSDAMRAVQTAEFLAAATGLPVRRDARLRERGLGHWEGLTIADVAQRFPDEYAEWTAGRDVSRPGGETREQVAARVHAAVAQLPDVALTIMVMHGASSMALINALLGLDQDHRPLMSLSNCHWSELAESPRNAAGGWRLWAHNVGLPDRQHAEPDEREAADAQA